ncbi:MAG: S1 family peptidase [Bacteroidota bacterium]
MYKQIWNECHASICSINFYNNAGFKTLSNTGFKIDDFIVTDDFFLKNGSYGEVEIFFVEIDGNTRSHQVRVDFELFRSMIIQDDNNMNSQFALIKCDFPEFHEIPSLQMSVRNQFEIGEEVAVVGFQTEETNLSIKQGVLSSYLIKDGKKLLEFDSSLRMGNSGSPLISVGRKQVMGIVGHRLASLTRAYNNMNGIINENLRLLKQVEGKINIQSIDPIQVLIASQNQIKHISKEFYKSSQITNGFALDISHVASFLEKTDYEDFEYNKSSSG